MNHNEENHYFLSIEGAGVFFTVGHLHPSLMFTGKVLILESHWVCYNLAQNFRLVTSDCDKWCSILQNRINI